MSELPITPLANGDSLSAHEAECCCAIVRELSDMGMEVVRTLKTQLAAAPLTVSADALEQVSSAVHCAIVLSRCLPHPAPSGQDLAGMRTRILREVEEAVGQQKTSGRGRHVGWEDRDAELLDELDEFESEERELDRLEYEIANRPAAKTLAMICRDLGSAAALSRHAWARGTEADLARLCARAALP